MQKHSSIFDLLRFFLEISFAGLVIDISTCQKSVFLEKKCWLKEVSTSLFFTTFAVDFFLKSAEKIETNEFTF